MLTITKKLDMSPHGVPQVIRVSQYDSDFTLEFKLFASGGNFAISTGTTAEIRGTKQSGTGYSASATLDTSTKVVTVAGAAQMTAVAGMNIYEIVLKKDNKEISSANFCLLVERAALDADTITDESVLKELNSIIEGAETATQAAEEAEDAADRAEAAAQTLVIDSTLTQEGQAADAKATGDAIARLEDEIAQIVPGLSSEAKDALLACFEHVAWSTPNGDSYYQALADALEDESSYIGELVFPIFAESSPSNEQRYKYDSGTGRMGIEPSLSDSRNRVACDISTFAVQAGDVITLDDSTTYAFAIGVNNSWIGGGYLSDYPFVVQSGDIPSIKEILVKRNDNADFTQADIDYLKAHIKLKRTVNKYLDRISVSYDNEVVHLPADAPTFVRPDLTVTAYYSDGTSENVTMYKLTTNVSTGTNAVRIKYGSKTASVNVDMVERVYFLKSTTLDNGAYRWGNSGETPSENSGYLLTSEGVDNVSANISNIPFYAGDTIYFAFLDEFKYAIGTNVIGTSYNNRLWIGGGYFADASYTLLEADVSDMKVFYVRAKDNTSDIQTNVKKNRIMRVYVERGGA